ncbi:hypothetical protein PSN45_005116 [Yamadazyma tenuis]|uniref:Sm protein F n=1 Tax=Candida tenuis (strain ATCC 10573 / BCRC 21748 / CBS 615 / JCM 9827 / NBRC 10315 / NRRL Y-1498 / VKM Y-70) TaxID=590646 RepID=G3B2V3_CANTC|nr:small nuclear ribonucleoprotein SmF [Yamadazyma tenuis ATCC 10573]XP_006686018.1 uncharacterized protein CANTEDRAFT_134081 [Yamadazyma tenuis ATCC 10573]EGV65211.1 small nuclear ribonucleo protein SmF [Yamadazyma tenuis ATCC 10573]EGV65212.1 hypothetical protein CANTEDRAFT_134081 [Yamadazyma tenuis ATCC 10573]WEJ97560.1 hypothetical protein PSN45_005116 [Yamadazyma tenuis]
MSSTSFNPINPKPFLKTLLNKRVIVRLKWNKTEYTGNLVSVDNYMNFQLDDASETAYVDGKKTAETVGEVFIRCNNVLFVREATDTATAAVPENEAVEAIEMEQ